MRLVVQIELNGIIAKRSPDKIVNAVIWYR